MRDILTAFEAVEEIGNLEKQEVAITEEIAEVLEIKQKDQLPVLRDIPQKKLLEETAKVVKFCVNLKHTALQRLMNHFMQEHAVVANRLRVKINKAAERKEPMWKRRLQIKIDKLRKDLSQLESSKDKEVSNARHWETLERKYSTRIKTLGVVIEEL